MATTQIAVRVDEGVPERAEKLIAWVQEQPFVSEMGRVTKADIYRMAMDRGMKALEEEKAATETAQTAGRAGVSDMRESVGGTRDEG